MDRNTTIPAPLGAMGETFRQSRLPGASDAANDTPADSRVWKYVVWGVIAVLVLSAYRYLTH